jgi:hypothetical protein
MIYLIRALCYSTNHQWHDDPLKLTLPLGQTPPFAILWHLL